MLEHRYGPSADQHGDRVRPSAVTPRKPGKPTTPRINRKASVPGVPPATTLTSPSSRRAGSLPAVGLPAGCFATALSPAIPVDTTLSVAGYSFKCLEVMFRADDRATRTATGQFAGLTLTLNYPPSRSVGNCPWSCLRLGCGPVRRCAVSRVGQAWADGQKKIGPRSKPCEACQSCRYARSSPRSSWCTTRSEPGACGTRNAASAASLLKVACTMAQCDLPSRFVPGRRLGT